jgi:hypothetical protein
MFFETDFAVHFVSLNLLRDDQINIGLLAPARGHVAHT